MFQWMLQTASFFPASVLLGHTKAQLWQLPYHYVPMSPANGIVLRSFGSTGLTKPQMWQLPYQWMPKTASFHPIFGSIHSLLGINFYRSFTSTIGIKWCASHQYSFDIKVASLLKTSCHKRHRSTSVSVLADASVAIIATNAIVWLWIFWSWSQIVTTRIFKPVHLYKFLIFVFLRIFFYFKQKRCRSVSQIKTEHFACRNRCRSKIENQTEYAYISDHISPWRSTSVFPFFF